MTLLGLQKTSREILLWKLIKDGYDAVHLVNFSETRATMLALRTECASYYMHCTVTVDTLHKIIFFPRQKPTNLFSGEADELRSTSISIQVSKCFTAETF